MFFVWTLREGRKMGRGNKAKGSWIGHLTDGGRVF